MAKHQNLAFKPLLRCIQPKWSFLGPATHFLKIMKNNRKRIFYLYGLCFLCTTCKRNQQETFSSCYSSSAPWRRLSPPSAQLCVRFAFCAGSFPPLQHVPLLSGTVFNKVLIFARTDLLHLQIFLTNYYFKSLLDDTFRSLTSQ